MEIETVRLTSEMTMLKVTGPLDPQHPVMVRARELVLSTGSADMLRSFDAALGRGVF